jgi:hypothetical protein
MLCDASHGYHAGCFGQLARLPIHPADGGSVALVASESGPGARGRRGRVSSSDWYGWAGQEKLLSHRTKLGP